MTHLFELGSLTHSIGITLKSFAYQHVFQCLLANGTKTVTVNHFCHLRTTDSTTLEQLANSFTTCCEIGIEIAKSIKAVDKANDAVEGLVVNYLA